MKNIKIEDKKEYVLINGRYAVYKINNEVYDTYRSWLIPKYVREQVQKMQKENQPR